MHPDRRQAFTLVEMLVVVAIIGVLVGLLLPSVQACRETARASSCKNNMLQVFLGVSSYQATFGVYPAGTVTDRLPARMFPDGKDHGWLVQTRPYFGGGQEFEEEWSPVHSAYHPRNWPLAWKGSGHTQCPSDPMQHMSDVAPLSYAGIHDGRDAAIDTASRGMMIANRFLRPDDVTDGLSNTLQLGEIVVDPANTFFWIAGNQSTLRTTGIPPHFPDYGSGWWGTGEERTDVAYGLFADPPSITYEMLEKRLQQLSADPSIPEFELAGAALMELDAEISKSRSNLPTRVNPIPPKYPPYTLPKFGAAATQSMALGSQHAGYVHGVFADGRVAAIHREIDSKIYASIGIRDDALPMQQPLVEFP